MAKAASVRRHQSTAKNAICLVVLALILPVNAQQRDGSQRDQHQASQFTGTYVNRSGDWKILDLGDGKLKAACSLTYVYKVRGLLTAHIGEGSGEATLTGKTAVFKPEGTTACAITLKFVGNKLIVKQDGSDADCGFGHNVYANGTYRKQSNRPPKFDLEK
jgi:hypothetical protein